jgi:hypothetical protein
MLEDPVKKRAAIGAAIGAVVAIPLPFVGPIIGAIVGGGVGYFTAAQRDRHSKAVPELVEDPAVKVAFERHD